MKLYVYNYLIILGLLLISCDNQNKYPSEEITIFNKNFLKEWKHVKKQLKNLNPTWNEKYEILRYPKTKRIIGLDLSNKTVKNEGKSQFIVYHKGNLYDITPIKAMRIEKLILRGCALNNIEALKNMKLKCLDLAETGVTQLDILHGMPIEQLWIDDTKITDISPLRASPIKNLLLRNTLVSDLQPLADKKIMFLDIANTPAAKKKIPESLDVKYLIDK